MKDPIKKMQHIVFQYIQAFSNQPVNLIGVDFTLLDRTVRKIIKNAKESK